MEKRLNTVNELKKSNGSSMAIILITVLVFVKELTIPFGLLDELWCYNMGRGIAMGYLPYRDFDIVQMPLYAFVFSVPLMIDRSLIAFRIASGIFLSVMMSLIYKIIRDETKHEYALPAALCCIAIVDFVTYNTLLFLWALLLYLVNKHKVSVKRDIILGILAACCALSRQTAGSLIIIAEAFVVYLSAPKDNRQRGRAILFYLIGVSIPCVVFLVYLLATSSFNDFWDCCLFSLFGFGEKNNTIFANSIPLLLIYVAGVASDIVLYRETKDKNRLYHLILSVPIVLIALPIVDYMHLIFAALWSAIPVASGIKRFIGKHLQRRIYLLITVMVFVAVMGVSAFNCLGTSLNGHEPEFKLIPSDESTLIMYSELGASNRELKELGYSVNTVSRSAVLISVMEGNYDADIFIRDRVYRLAETDHPEYYDDHGFSTLKYVESLCSDRSNLILIPDNYDTEGWGSQSEPGVYDYVIEHCEPIRSIGMYTYYRPIDDGQ